jgi:hypothetical protein
MDAGNVRAAMEQAGFGVRLDLDRPDGYLILGELNLMDGDLCEARRSFAAAASKSKGETRIAALAGSAQVAWLASDLPEARSFYVQALREDASDPLNLRPALVEVLMRLGDFAAAKNELARCEDPSADVHVLAALVHWRHGSFRDAAASIRSASLLNLYLPSALAREAPPSFGLVHGVEEATPEHAEALVERLEPLLAADPDAAAFLVAVTRTATAREEQKRLVSLARRLQSERDPRERQALNGALDALRDPGRIASSVAAALEEVRRAQSGAPPPGSFDV